MWKHITYACSQTSDFLIRNVISPSLTATVITPVRTTFILRRRYQMRLHGKNSLPKGLKERDRVYDLVENTTEDKKLPELKLILTELVPGLGTTGDQVTVKQGYGYKDLLLPGRAVYASPENIEKYCSGLESNPKLMYSSPYVQQALYRLTYTCLCIYMNNIVPWTIEPWHIRASFRQSNIHVPEYAIEMPEKKISGPDMDLDQKLFVIKVTINKNPNEVAAVRCRIVHYTAGETQTKQKEDLMNTDEGEDYVFPEQALEYTFPKNTFL